MGVLKCKYCYMEEDGDVPSDRKNLIQRKVGRLYGRDIWLIGMIYENVLHVTQGNYDGTEVTIRFCPMCGRKL
ncbi:MAG: hypothetical protein IIZ78_01160 [Clostridiales bacterium]|nr:hypothetical protein [Clostridiales bacterium]